jgi:DNA-binding PadR family transcriptional regulator
LLRPAIDTAANDRLRDVILEASLGTIVVITRVATNPLARHTVRASVTNDGGEPTRTLTDLAFHVLLALGDGPSHGYAIGKDVAAQSAGRLDPSTGALYQALHRLRAEGLIAPAEAPESSDERRRYFQLTKVGRLAAEAEARRLAALIRTARKRKLYQQRI